MKKSVGKRRLKREKLVRDGIPALYADMQAKGYRSPNFRQAAPYEKLLLLCNKLNEEAREARREALRPEVNAVDLRMELGDVLEVIDAICELSNISKKELAAAQSQKRARFGGFKEFHVMELKR